jgi:hypothetical protein
VALREWERESAEEMKRIRKLDEEEGNTDS